MRLEHPLRYIIETKWCCTWSLNLRNIIIWRSLADYEVSVRFVVAQYGVNVVCAKHTNKINQSSRETVGMSGHIQIHFP